jgi:hypothetical protein
VAFPRPLAPLVPEVGSARARLLQTPGVSGFRIFGLVVTEASIVSTVGGLLGIGAALATLEWTRGGHAGRGHRLLAIG